MKSTALTRARNLAKALLPFSRKTKLNVASLPGIPVPAGSIETLASPEVFRDTLLALMAQAKRRILLAALYLQDDEAGRAILKALYEAKAARPELEIGIWVDWHRAQRGLIGKTKSPGNAAYYRDLAKQLGPGIDIWGVPVQTREILGVLHLKGFVIDDALLYSGASLNEVYLHWKGRYRLDRYHLLRSPALAESFATLLKETFQADEAVHRLNAGTPPDTAALRPAIARFRRRLKRASYLFEPKAAEPGEVLVTPLLGLGRSGNPLNTALVQLIQQAQREVVLFTPYFNLPRPLRKALRERLQAGCRITIVLGDKTANDFYLPPEEPFKLIGTLPYLYEANLRRFCKTHLAAIRSGQLNIHLWKEGDHTFHLKGLMVDEAWAVLTGNNLNPRAWGLDLENGLLLHDAHGLLKAQHAKELEGILKHTTRIQQLKDLQTMKDYPPAAQRLLKRLTRPRIDRLLNQIL